MHNKFILLTALIPIFCSAPVFGEAVNLQEAISRALGSNLLLKAAALEKDAAREGAAASRSRYLPRLFLESGATLSDTPSRVFMMKLDEGRINPGTDFAAGTLNRPPARGDFRSALTLEQPLLDLGVSTGAALAGKEAESAAISEEKSREQVAFRVYLAYLAVRKAKAFSEIAGQAVADAREHGRLAEVREKDGVGLKSDQLRASTALFEAREQQLSANNDLLLARLRLNLVVGGPQGGERDIAGFPEVAEPVLSEGELVALARLHRPELRQAEKALEKGDLAVRQTRDAYFPTVYANAAYQLNDRDLPFGADGNSWSVGVNLRWELFDGNRRSHEKGRAENARQAAAAMLEDDRREVSLQVTEGVLRRQEAALKLVSARATLQAAEEGARLTTLRFKNGLSSMVELMDAESVLNRSRAHLVEVENSFLGSTGELYYQSGVFLKEVMR